MSADRLVHWSSTPAGACSRKDSGQDALVVSPQITYPGVADWPGNVTCPTCCRVIRQERRARRQPSVNGS
jgi:hypothetical protein